MMQRMIVLFVLFLTPIAGCDSVRNLGKRDVQLAAVAYVDREDNLLVDDRYKLHVVIFHKEPNAVKGRYVVRAYGDVFGEGGQVNPLIGDNYDETIEATLEPGRAGGASVFYYINNPALTSNNLDPTAVKVHVNMRVEIDFIPLVDDPKYRKTSAILKYTRGNATIAPRE